MDNRNLSIANSIDLDFGTVSKTTDGILTFIPKPSRDTVSMEELKTMLTVLEELSEGEPCPFYCDNTHITKLSFNGRKFIGDNLHRFALASAVKQNSPLTRYIGHTIMAMFPPKVPMRMFSSETDAIKWLDQFNN